MNIVENGNDIKTIMYDKEGEIQGQIKYEKTPEGLTTKRTDVDSNGVITSIITTEPYRLQDGVLDPQIQRRRYAQRL